ncbi:helix-turn-helix transcriptional regulator [Kribbella sandramycini]|uniref:Helix-turn-helix transcriptional regulator n=1 Tax=Kribbella sandramycini TaxID=60450 RepID=A0A7Y4NYH9_9ACTN|nr:transcriptional regulator with XRE-family HTH domain [Kribbella sandramycini]NOL39858.1 helix-turn-helix transcriptional regulator [Kribbella sandramycini]
MPRPAGLPTVRLRRVAAELRELRDGAGLSREQVQERVGVGAGVLARIEQGRAKPAGGVLEALFEAYDVPAGRRGELLELVRGAKRPGWLRQYERVTETLSDGYLTYVGFEAEAKALHSYQPLLVPGLLQTEEYAAATIENGLTITAEAVELRVRTRLERQANLVARGSGEPLQFWAVVDEAVLRRAVGGAAVMRRQLERLLEEAERPNVTLQVIPFHTGAYPGMVGSFVRLVFGGAVPDLVYEERVGTDLFLELEAELDRYGDVFDKLRVEALSPRDSSTFISTILAERS